MMGAPGVLSFHEMSVTRSRVLQGRRLALNAQWRWFDLALIAWAVLCALASVLFALNSRCRHSLAGIGSLGVVLFAVGNVLYVGMAIWSGLARVDVSAEPTDSAGPYRKTAMPPSPGPPVSLAEMRSMLVPYALLYFLSLLLILAGFVLFSGIHWGAVR